MAKMKQLQAADVLCVLTKEPQKMDTIIEKFAYTSATVRARLSELVESGKVIREGQTRATTYRLNKGKGRK